LFDLGAFSAFTFVPLAGCFLVGFDFAFAFGFACAFGVTLAFALVGADFFAGVFLALDFVFAGTCLAGFVETAFTFVFTFTFALVFALVFVVAFFLATDLPAAFVAALVFALVCVVAFFFATDLLAAFDAALVFGLALAADFVVAFDFAFALLLVDAFVAVVFLRFAAIVPSSCLYHEKPCQNRARTLPEQLGFAK